MAVIASTLVVLIVASSTLCAPTAEQSLTNIEQSVADLRKALLSGHPRDCADLYISGQNHSGVFNIFPYEGSKPAIATYCDMESDGGGWTVFQRRGQFGNPVYYFYRDWKAYKNGFGDPAKEFWLGNELIHVMTSNKAMSLRIVLTNRTGETFTADYALFKIAGENEQYKLIVSGYTGAAGYDAFSGANGSSFSTFDKDNDKYPDGNCAVTYRGAWWYTRCHMSNLNGLNLDGAHASFADGIEWSIRGGVKGLQRYSYPQVFQRRGQFGNPVYDFYRDWKAYKNCFGDPAKEFWLGNQLIHVMTSNKAMSLRIVLTNRTGETFTADYALFKIAGENEQYKLIVSGYTGAAGYDAFSQANGSSFSTFDKDNDMNPDGNCAVTYRGAWWYTRCHVANLNGLNLDGAHASFADGIEWSIRGGVGGLYHYSYPQVEMKMRDASFETLAARIN
ncbi:techylectin-5A-like [Ornithodoros turicata]|uniref:techylectin-5A-like n=1 Tax=Ornithodoros turicata TaxID=34597 RepID=UPI0031389BB4